MFGKIFDGFKNRVVGEVKKKALSAFNAWVQEALAAAKSLDLDNDGKKDFQEVQDIMHRLKDAFVECLEQLADIAPIIKSIQMTVARALPDITELSKLFMLYVTKFGFKKPTTTLASLEPAQEDNVA